MVQSPSRFDRPTDDQSASPAISLDQRIQEALTYARTVSTAQGISSTEAIVAWDIVEELLAEKSHRQQKTQRRAATARWDRYCEEFPSRVECLLYDL